MDQIDFVPVIYSRGDHVVFTQAVVEFMYIVVDQ